MEEIWKDIIGYEGSYQVSNLGRVKSLNRISLSGRFLKSKMMSLYNKPGKYVRCNLFMEKDITYSVHRLVADAFIPNPLNKLTVNHIDGNKNNNIADNLEWATYSENMQHAFDIGLLNGVEILKGKIGENHPYSKLTALDIEMIKCLSKAGFNYKQIAERFGVVSTHIGLIIKNKSWNHLTGEELTVNL